MRHTGVMVCPALLTLAGVSGFTAPVDRACSSAGLAASCGMSSVSRGSRRLFLAFLSARSGAALFWDSFLCGCSNSVTASSW